MRFQKNVPTENRAFLLEQLKKYKQEMTLSKEELKDVENWVSRGRSPYDNGDYICTEGGYPMDYISAERFLKEEYEWYRNQTDEDLESGQRRTAYDTTADDAVIIAGTSAFRKPWESELPFN